MKKPRQERFIPVCATRATKAVLGAQKPATHPSQKARQAGHLTDSAAIFAAAAAQSGLVFCMAI